FEHQDQMGNKKAIKAGDVQWMSTGYGVIHSEMPLADSKEGMHGFQIWLNMPAKDKLRPARYQDSSDIPVPEFSLSQGIVKILAGRWQLNGESYDSPLADLAADSAIADLQLKPNSVLNIDAKQAGFLGAYLYQGSIWGATEGEFVSLNASQVNSIETGEDGAGLLLFKGNPIKEKIAHMGPFVMNTQEELRQAVRDYQQGRFGTINH
ncbi:pirin family protein, partial [Planctobacterium marinum]